VVDKDAVKAKVKSFVDAYNAATDSIRSRITEKTVPNAKNNVDAAKGALFGDLGLTNILANMRMTVMNPVAVGNPTTVDELREIGVSTGAVSPSAVATDSVQGKLTFDEAAFDKQWTADPTAVQRLLKGTTTLNGFSQSLDAVLSPLTQGGGILDGRLTASDSELKRITDSMKRMDDRLAAKEAYYKKTFTSLEKAMATMQQQQTAMNARLMALR
jgi:flagellar hook-associated protein 2